MHVLLGFALHKTLLGRGGGCVFDGVLLEKPQHMLPLPLPSLPIYENFKLCPGDFGYKKMCKKAHIVSLILF